MHLESQGLTILDTLNKPINRIFRSTCVVLHTGGRVNKNKTYAVWFVLVGYTTHILQNCDINNTQYTNQAFSNVPGLKYFIIYMAIL